jgi:Ca2+-binding RTX toxin-like protein
VKVSLSGTGALAGDTVQLYSGTGTGSQLGSSYTLTNTDISNSFANVQTGTLTNGTTYTLTARLTDQSGNQSAVSTNSFTVTEDTTAPAVTESLVSDTGSSSSDKITSNPALTGSGDPNVVVTLNEGSTILATATANASGAWSFTPTGLSDGPHTIVASETDAAGNTGTASLTFTLDTTPPLVSITSTGGLTNHPTQTVSGTVDVTDVGTLVTLYDGTTALGTATVESNGSWSKSITLTGDGTHTLTAQDTDPAGNTGTSNAITFTLDTTAPVPVITSEVLSKSGAVKLTGTTGEANDSISVYDDTTLLGTTTTASNGTWSFTTGKVSNVVHTYTATATDVAGNVGHGSNEAILGSSKTDTLVGTSGNDIINGNGGNDTITGGLGADTLTGGSGRVTFAYNAILDSTPSSHDTITDFRHGHDKIDFTNIAGINASDGVPTFQGKLAGSGSLALNAHSVAYIEVGGNTEVLVNTTNNAEMVTTSNVSAANMEIVLVGIHLGLTSTDFHHL